MPPPFPQDILLGGLALAERRGEGKGMQHIHSTLGENAAGLTYVDPPRALFFPPSTSFASAALLVQQRFPRSTGILIAARPKLPEKTLCSIHRSDVHKWGYL